MEHVIRDQIDAGKERFVLISSNRHKFAGEFIVSSLLPLSFDAFIVHFA